MLEIPYIQVKTKLKTIVRAGTYINEYIFAQNYTIDNSRKKHNIKATKPENRTPKESPKRQN
jgi:hypothetical protein